MTSSTAHGDQLPSPPADGVTALCFAAGSSLLLASSWDGVRTSRPHSFLFLIESLRRSLHLSLGRCNGCACTSRMRCQRYYPHVTDCSVSAWLQTLRLYDAEQKKLLAVQHSRKALLDCAVESSESALSGGLTGTLQR
jgi:hypothetical protein